MTAHAVQIRDRPRSRIGTPAHTGPYARLRSNDARRIPQAAAAWDLIERRGLTVRAAAAILGLSTTTTWRRARWYADWTLGPAMYGLPYGPPPHQRGTRAVPRGRPIILPLDAPDVYRQLRAAGLTPETIAADRRTVPECVRDLAHWEMMRERLSPDVLERLESERARIAAARPPSPAARYLRWQ